MNHLILLAGSVWLISCIDLLPEHPNLTGTVMQNGNSTNCNSCHQYPPQDKNHDMHIFHLDENQTIAYADKITCYDCHVNSILADTQVVIDTFFYGFFGELLSGRKYPEDTILRQSGYEYIDTLNEIKLLFSNSPIEGEPELITGWSHFNGNVDVKMIPSITLDSLPFYDSKKLTCSSVSCHGNEKPYPMWVGFAQEIYVFDSTNH